MQTKGLKVAIASVTFAAGMLFAGAVFAQAVLTFEGLKDNEAVNNYYNGGLGGSGSGPGPNLGIVFSSSSVAFIEQDAGGTGNFKQEPSPRTTITFLSGTAATMNVPAGFTTGFSFFYSAANQPGVIRVWSGQNGTGSLLATLNLPVTGNGGSSAACNLKNFCPFVPVGVTFSGVAQSVDFSGTINQIGFDNITLGSATASGSSAVQIPALSNWAFILLVSLLAIAGVFVVRRGQSRG